MTTTDTAAPLDREKLQTTIHLNAHISDADAKTPLAYLDRSGVQGLIAPWTYVVVKVDRGVTLSMSPARAARLRDELARVLEAWEIAQAQS